MYLFAGEALPLGSVRVGHVPPALLETGLMVLDLLHFLSNSLDSAGLDGKQADPIRERVRARAAGLATLVGKHIALPAPAAAAPLYPELVDASLADPSRQSQSEAKDESAGPSDLTASRDQERPLSLVRGAEQQVLRSLSDSQRNAWRAFRRGE